jgi:hypothetical protein
MSRRLAVLGLSGLMLIAMVAGALRIHRLEQRIAALETARAPVALAPVAAVSSPGLDFRWEPAGNDQMAVQPPHQFPQFPNAPTRHEINGMTYYVVPLADSGGATSRR